mmetsp:Transcript_30936/g.92729  ORF Transcript_30936/g.92729 Transcript_30936/m.92729 type:complete len:202 (-) Transcript_30936:37-642(-)
MCASLDAGETRCAPLWLPPTKPFIKDAPFEPSPYNTTRPQNLQGANILRNTTLPAVSASKLSGVRSIAAAGAAMARRRAVESFIVGIQKIYTVVTIFMSNEAAKTARALFAVFGQLAFLHASCLLVCTLLIRLPSSPFLFSSSPTQQAPKSRKELDPLFRLRHSRAYCHHHSYLLIPSVCYHNHRANHKRHVNLMLTSEQE